MGEEQGQEFHGTPLIISWLVLANAAVLIAAFRWSKYSFYLHLLLGLAIIILTLIAAIPFLKYWFNELNQTRILTEKQGQDTFQTVHNYVGLILVCLMGIQVIFGLISRIVKYSQVLNPNICIWTRRIHMISSYIILVLAKFNYLQKQFQQGATFFIILAVDIVCLIAYLIIKFKYFTFSKVITNYEKISQKEKQQKFFSWFFHRIKNVFNPPSPLSYNIKYIDQLYINKYKSEKQIKHQNYVIFNDYVYDTTQLKTIHPGGQYLIENTNKRQIDRFIYGSSPFQILPDIKVHQHTKDSLYILGHPIGKIQRESPINGMNQLSLTNIVKKRKLGAHSSTYILHLKMFNKNIQQKQSQTERKTNPSACIKFSGYKNQNQFGQYFTLSLTDKDDNISCTRLYTTIWCMRPQNIKFIQTYFSVLLQNQVNDQVKSSEFRQTQMQVIGGNQSQIVPLIIKKYQTGKFTSQLLDQCFKGNCIISKPMGKGMAFNKLKSDGKVIMICGGTGILPFCDFIDILFKRIKYLQNNNLSLILLEKDPIVSQDIFMQRQFILYHAVQQVDDIPSIILYQINELCSSKFINFKSIMRISKNSQNLPQSYKKNINLTKEYFNQQIRKQHLSEQQRGNLNMIYICGSKKINQQIGNILIEEKITQNLYHFM